jgi:hypothetical protein
VVVAAVVAAVAVSAAAPAAEAGIGGRDRFSVTAHDRGTWDWRNMKSGGAEMY